MRCTVCCQDYKQSDIIDNYFVKDTSEATNTSSEKSAQVLSDGLEMRRMGMIMLGKEIMFIFHIFIVLGTTPCIEKYNMNNSPIYYY